MALTDATRTALLNLVEAGCGVVSPSRFSAIGSRYGIAYYDSTRDRPITEIDPFAPAVAALQGDATFSSVYGAENAHRLAIQFVYNTCKLLDAGASVGEAFEATWSAFAAETAEPNWHFAGLANLNNFNYDGQHADLGHGVSILGRSFERLQAMLRLDEVDLERITDDWSTGGNASSFVLIAETNQPKNAANIILSSDGNGYPLAARAILAMRLQGTGDIHLGRMFLSRPAVFNVGIGGKSTAGMTICRPGPQYVLDDDMIPAIRKQVDALIQVENQLASARHIGLALRSFSSTYDRLFHQAEDRIIDSITALEALWKIDSELSFRLAFRTSSLLGNTDDDREAIFETLRKYYKIRSKIVHGGALSAAESTLVQNDEPLRALVRRTLGAFVHLLANPGDWTVGRLGNDPDLVLLHTARRSAVRQAMAL